MRWPPPRTPVADIPDLPRAPGRSLVMSSLIDLGHRCLHLVPLAYSTRENEKSPTSCLTPLDSSVLQIHRWRSPSTRGRQPIIHSSFDGGFEWHHHPRSLAEEGGGGCEERHDRPHTKPTWTLSMIFATSLAHMPLPPAPSALLGSFAPCNTDAFLSMCLFNRHSTPVHQHGRSATGGE